MDQKIFDKKLEIAPENLFPIVRNFLLARQARYELGPKRDNSVRHYEAEQDGKSYSIDIRAKAGELVGTIVVWPLTPHSARVKIIFNDWESDVKQNLTSAMWHGYEFDSNKKQMFLDLGWYILSIIDGEEAANIWMAGSKSELNMETPIIKEDEQLYPPAKNQTGQIGFDRGKILRMLEAAFNVEDLRQICSELNIDHEIFSSKKNKFIRELTEYVER